MTNEIKEILFLLHNDRLTDSAKRKLEDYITNLQEENKKLKEKLKNNGIVKTCENCEWFGVCPHSYREYDYKSKIDKAIEYIEKIFYVKSGLSPKQATDLLEILRGDE